MTRPFSENRRHYFEERTGSAEAHEYYEQRTQPGSPTCALTQREDAYAMRLAWFVRYAWPHLKRHNDWDFLEDVLVWVEDARTVAVLKEELRIYWRDYLAHIEDCPKEFG